VSGQKSERNAIYILLFFTGKPDTDDFRLSVFSTNPCIFLNKNPIIIAGIRIPDFLFF